MAGVFEGIGNIFTGGGGAPEFDGISDSDLRQLTNRQMAFGQTSASTMQDWLNQVRGTYGAQQSLLPLVYGELGIQPQYNEVGQIIGYQRTGDLPPGGENVADVQQMLQGYFNDPAWQQQHAAELQSEAQQRYNALGESGLGALNLAGQDLYGPEFNAEGLDAMRGNLSTLQALQGNELQRMGMVQGSDGRWYNDPNANEARARALGGQMLTRAEQAMKGQAEIDPTLQRQLIEQEQQLRAQLQANLGPGYETTTAGRQALSDFARQRSEAIYASNQDTINRATSQYGGLQASGLDTIRALYGIGQPVGQAAESLANTTMNQQNVRENQRSARFNRFNQTLGATSNTLGNQAQMNLAYEAARNSMPFLTMREMRSARQADLAAQSERLAQQGGRLQNLYGGISQAYRDPGLSSIAALTGQLGTANTAFPWAQANWQGAVTNDATNQNNIFWRSMAQSAGNSIGQGAGGGFFGKAKGAGGFGG